MKSSDESLQSPKNNINSTADIIERERTMTNNNFELSEVDPDQYDFDSFYLQSYNTLKEVYDKKFVNSPQFKHCIDELMNNMIEYRYLNTAGVLKENNEPDQ